MVIGIVTDELFPALSVALATMVRVNVPGLDEPVLAVAVHEDQLPDTFWIFVADCPLGPVTCTLATPLVVLSAAPPATAMVNPLAGPLNT